MGKQVINGNAKLTWDQVRAIRRLHELDPTLRQWQLAELYGVHRCTVRDLLHGKAWADLAEMMERPAEDAERGQRTVIARAGRHR